MRGSRERETERALKEASYFFFSPVSFFFFFFFVSLLYFPVIWAYLVARAFLYSKSFFCFRPLSSSFFKKGRSACQPRRGEREEEEN